MAASSCPSADILRQFYEGRLAMAEMESWQGHVEICPSCLDQLRLVEGEHQNSTLRWISTGSSESLLPVRPAAEVPWAPRSAPLDALSFWEAVWQAGLFTPHELAEYRAEVEQQLGEQPTPQAIADYLLSVQRLTPYQAEQLLRGSARNLSVGNYVLLEPIGRGGMGQVFRARQRRLNRIVALKMILAGEFASQEERLRFHCEAQAAAQLQHPGIVPVYEVGESEGRHFYSMAYLAGQSLREVVASGPVAPRRAVEIMLPVAKAVEYAHQQGVVHRDLKPHNILFDAHGQPLVADFGLAKHLDQDQGLTATGQLLGTPSYMSPEQAASGRAPVDVRTDVYSLGAVLYCLVTGRPPFQAESALETLKQVLELAPAPPRLVNPATPRDLDTICMKCLEKEAGRRYATVRELADDLQRFLEQKPIAARPIGKVRAAVKLIRRHPTVATFVATTLLSAIVGMLGVVGAWRQAVEDRNRALESRRLALQVADRTFVKLTLDERFDYPHTYPLSRELAASAIEFYTDFVNEWQDDPTIESELAAAYCRSAWLRINIGIFRDDREDLQRAAQLYRKLSARHPARGEYQNGLAQSLQLLGTECRRRGELQRGVEHLEEARALCSRAYSDPKLEVDRCFLLAEASIKLAQIGELRNRPQEAVQYSRQAVEILQQLARDRPTDWMAQRLLIRLQLEHGLFLKTAGQLDSALHSLDEALVAAGQFPEMVRQQTLVRQTVAACHNAKGLIYLHQYSDLAEAELSLALSLREQLLREVPIQRFLFAEVATTLSNLARLKRMQGAHAEALHHSARCCRVYAQGIDRSAWSTENQEILVRFQLEWLDTALALGSTDVSPQRLLDILQSPADPQVRWRTVVAVAERMQPWPARAAVDREAAASVLADVLPDALAASRHDPRVVATSPQFAAFRETKSGTRFLQQQGSAPEAALVDR